MHRFSFVVLPALLWAACGARQVAPLPDMVLGGFAVPESVLYDRVGDVYLVSNIRGKLTEKDGNGSIARIEPGGKIEWAFIVGGDKGVELNAPKGMAIAGEQLWVADIDVVRTFDRRSGLPRGSVAIAGATFLNGVSVAPDGTVWVTDTGLNPDFSPNGTEAVWAIGRDGAVRKVKAGPGLGQPNGIVATAAGARFVTWDTGELVQLDAQGHRTLLGKAPAAQLDGLVRIGEDRWICSSWAGKCLYEFDGNGAVHKIEREGFEFEQPAGIGYDSRRDRLLVPLFGRNEVALRRR